MADPTCLRVADLYLLDALVQRSLGHFEQLLQFRGQLLATGTVIAASP